MSEFLFPELNTCFYRDGLILHGLPKPKLQFKMSTRFWAFQVLFFFVFFWFGFLLEKGVQLFYKNLKDVSKMVKDLF